MIVLPIDPTADRARRAWLECPRCEHGRACAVCQSSRNCGNHWQFLLSNQGTLVHLQCRDCGLWSTDTREAPVGDLTQPDIGGAQHSAVSMPKWSSLCHDNRIVEVRIAAGESD